MSTQDRLSLALAALDLAGKEGVIFNAQPRLAYNDLRGTGFTQKVRHLFDRALQFGLVEDAGGTLDFAIVEITRNKFETRGVIATAYARLKSDGILIINGDKHDGIESHLKALKKLLPMSEVISKAHGKVFWISKSTTPDIFATWQTKSEASENIDGFITKPGVFSADHIDNGSFFLSEFLPPLEGKIADLGAGWGFLAQSVLSQSPSIETLDLIEADKAALSCAQQNVQDARANFLWEDALNYQGGPYDAIIMNPPFHQSRKTDEGLGKSFIQAASRLLTPRGILWMVANRQLAYESVLKESFASGQILQESPQFKIIRAEKPKG
ncbi:MAG: methyltransferase [Pseudomonadota bacterium]